jgi:hypothetical protein
LAEKLRYTKLYFGFFLLNPGTELAQLLSYQKVAGSIPDVSLEFFIDINLSDRTMALRSTHPLTEMSTRRIS